MDRTSATVVLALVSALLASGGHAQTRLPILGVWQTDDKDSAAEFYTCGDKVCARLIWFKAASDSAASPRVDPRVDQHNPDPALRTRPLCGMDIITRLTPRAPTHLDGGKVYSAGTGKTYDLAVDVEAPTRLRLRGYLGTPLLGQTFFMTRNDTLPHCQTYGRGH
jgi:uncharacterized protein (DUF2147 family)